MMLLYRFTFHLTGNEANFMDYQPNGSQNGTGNGYNPYNPYNPYGTPLQPAPVKPRGESMATASMILGILSLAGLLLLRMSLPFTLGGVGIILAILSRGSARKMLGRAKAGIICCIVALTLDVALCISAVYLVFALPRIAPELMDDVNKVCEEQYGVSYEEMMEEIYDMFDDYE